MDFSQAQCRYCKFILSAAKAPMMVSGEMIGLDVDELVITIISHIPLQFVQWVRQLRFDWPCFVMSIFKPEMHGIMALFNTCVCEYVR